MKKIVVLSGAGISAESGIKTFREMGGLWEEYDVMDVASIDGWHKNPKLVLDFYNKRRSELQTAEPNNGHRELANLELFYDVTIITQNVDNLHEKAGSTKILHLHGELTKIESSVDKNYIIDIGYKNNKLGDLCPKGFQLRPHIVWFGEAVPLINEAIEITKTADVFIVVGTSMQVYPAASLINFVPAKCPIYLVDPNPTILSNSKITVIKEPASTGITKVVELI